MTQAILTALVLASLVGGQDNGQGDAISSHQGRHSGIRTPYLIGWGDRLAQVSSDETNRASGEQLTATHYGESYNGQQMGCPGAGRYDSSNINILAVGPSRYQEWPCNTQLRVCHTIPDGGLEPPVSSQDTDAADQGSMSELWCISVTRTDSCPGCHHTLIDLSEAGIAALGCIDICQVAVSKVDDSAISR